MTSRAFSLVELLIVASIICLLASILVPAVANAARVAKMAQCGSNLHQLRAAAEMVRADHKRGGPEYDPADWVGLVKPHIFMAVADAPGGVLLCPEHIGLEQSQQSSYGANNAVKERHIGCARILLLDYELDLADPDDDWGQWYVGGHYAQARHIGDKINTIFGDGHVEAFTGNEIRPSLGQNRANYWQPQ